jgi:hypothetical protein
MDLALALEKKTTGYHEGFNCGGRGVIWAGIEKSTLS